MKGEGKIPSGLDTSNTSCSANANGGRESGRNAISRSMTTTSAGLGRRRAKAIGLLLVLATAIVIVAAAGYVPSTNDADEPGAPADVQQKPPGPPLNVFGYVKDELGTPLVGVVVTVTDLTHYGSGTNTTSSTGLYRLDLGVYAAWELGDIVEVNATSGSLSGSAQAPITSTASLRIDFTMTEIPEFPMVIVPVVGMMVLVAVVSLKRRGEEK